MVNRMDTRIRLVDKDWKHPRLSNGEFKPLLDSEIPKFENPTHQQTYDDLRGIPIGPVTKASDEYLAFLAHVKENAAQRSWPSSPLSPFWMDEETGKIPCSRCVGRFQKPPDKSLRDHVRKNCIHCDGTGVELSQAEQESAIRRRREADAEQERKWAVERAEFVAEENKETARINALLSPPRRTPLARLFGWREPMLEIGKLAKITNLDRRAKQIEKEIAQSTSKQLRLHLDEQRERLRGERSDRRHAAAELEHMDVRAVPMLLDTWRPLLTNSWLEGSEKKAASAAYHALKDIRDVRAIFYLACFLRDWQLVEPFAELITRIDEQVGGFDALGTEDQIRCLVGLRRGDLLRERQKDTDRVLLSDLSAKDEAGRHFGLFALMGIGRESLIPKMIAILNSQEYMQLAVDYLNCGHSELIEAAENWARVRGYQIEKREGRPRIYWGSF